MTYVTIWKKDYLQIEAAVSNGVVRRLLDALDWPIYNPEVIIPEYSVGGQRVDFALCHPSSKPLVFIEVKQSGTSKDAEQQLFEYAFHEGVPIAILADEQKWQFFHPSGQGNYRERKVYELDLRKNNIEESVERLNRYLNYNRSIRPGKAVEAIKKDYEGVRQERQVATQLPVVWNELVQERNDYLLLAMMEKAKKKIGHEPTEEQVLDFLKSLKTETESKIREVLSPPTPASTFSNSKSKVQLKAPAKRLIVTMPNGEVIQHYNTMDTFREVIFKIGAERVLGVDIERALISTEPIPKRRTTPYRGYHITENHGTSVKQKLLERIASRLGIQMRVEIADKS